MSNRRLRCVVVLVCFICCSGPGRSRVLLQWSAEPGERRTYSALLGSTPDSLGRKIEASGLRDLLPNPPDASSPEGRGFYQGLHQDIRRLEIPSSLPSLLTLEGKARGSLELRLRGKDPGPPPGPEATALDRQAYRFRQRESRMFQLRALLSNRGDVLSFYLSQQQKNIPQLIFQLPMAPVKVGDRWPLATQLITASSRYVHKDSSRIGEAQLVLLETRPTGERVAGVAFVAAERYEGIADLPDGRTDVAFRIEATYVAYGELLLESGVWDPYVGELTQGSAGLGPEPTVKRDLYLLRPLPTGG